MNIDGELRALFAQILKHQENFQEKGSGWMVMNVERLQVHMSAYVPILGSGYVPLPPSLTKRKAIVNINNTDNQCFKWCILAYLHPVPGRQQPKLTHHYRPYSDELDFTDIAFPVPITRIPAFEAQNDVSVNVYGYSNVLYPIYLSQEPRERHVHLVHYKGHYSIIRSLDRLLSHENKHEHRNYFCDRCLNPQYSQERLTDHKTRCKTDQCQRVSMASEKILRFKNYRRQQRSSLVIYADFECLVEKLEHPKPNPNGPSITQTHKHTPCGFCLYPVMSCCPGHPGGTTLNLAEQHQVRLDNPVPLHMSPADQDHHDSAQECHICQEPIGPGEQKDRDYCHTCGRYRGPAHGRCNRDFRHIWDVSVVFHNSRHYDTHVIMRELGGVCNRRGYRIKVIPRGLEDYLGFMLFFCKRKKRGGRRGPQPKRPRHHSPNAFIDDLASEEDDGHRPIIGRKRGAEEENIDGDAVEILPEDLMDGPMDLIGDGDGDDVEPTTDNDVMARWCVHFVDTYQYLTASIEKLVGGLNKDTGFPHMREVFSGNDVDLIVRKGVYPYDYMTNWDWFNEEQLPDKLCFYSALTESDISDEDYAHAQVVWDAYECQNLGDYHDLYQKTDVILLADVIENFRATSMKHYGLDPIHYFTLPSFSWDAFLRMTKVEMELLQDQEMYTFLEAGIRVGVAMISHSRATANNPLADSDISPYDPTKPHTWIMYLDANNLYGWAMSQKLPLSDFQWVNVFDRPFFCRFEKTDGDWGYVVEVDIEYPEELHDLHNDLPLAPKRMVITDDMLSPYARDLRVAMGGKLGKGPKVEKLVPNLMNNKHYVVNLRTLQYYMSQGIEITNLHRVLKYRQKAFMEPYIRFNTGLRTLAPTDTEKYQYKLMNNAIFGKTMENVRQYKNIVLVTKQSQYRKLAKNPLYIRSSMFSEDLVAVHRQRHTVCLEKPIHIGQAILDISKELVFGFHHGHMIPRYGPEKCRLIGTDTDSLMYLIETPDIYKDMSENRELYDTSNYPTDHPLYNVTNKKVPGLWKDELAAHEVVALKPKMYSIVCPGGKDMRKAKGVKRYVVEKNIRHQHYVQVLENSTKIRHEMNMFRNYKHEIYTTTIRKTSLNAFEDKRSLEDDGIKSKAYRHCRIGARPVADGSHDDTVEPTINNEVPGDNTVPLWQPWL